MKITEALFAEHQVFHNLFDHIENTLPQSKTVAEVKTLASLLEATLAAHSRTEDELFIGPLEHCFAQIGHYETFHQEHDDIDSFLRQSQTASRLAQSRKSLLAAV